MADSRFFKKSGPFAVSDIIRIAEVQVLEGTDMGRVFADVASLEEATANDVSFAFIPSVKESLKVTHAGAVIVSPQFLNLVPAGTTALISKDPHRSFGLLAQAFYPQTVQAGISEKAIVDPTAIIGAGSQIDAGAIIGAKVVLGQNCHIHSGAVIEENVQMGNDCIVGANATVSHCVAGNKVYIYSGAQIGQDGFGFAMSVQGPTKVPQLGRVIIGDNVEIGSNTTVDRGAMGDTEIGSGSRIDNLVQIAHNVKIGHNCIIVAQVGIAGSCQFGDFVTAGGQVGFAGHLKIGTASKIAAQSGVMNDVPPKAVLMGSPALPRMEWMRQYVSLQALSKQKKAVPAAAQAKLKGLELLNKVKDFVETLKTKLKNRKQNKVETGVETVATEQTVEAPSVQTAETSAVQQPTPTTATGIQSAPMTENSASVPQASVTPTEAVQSAQTTTPTPTPVTATVAPQAHSAPTQPMMAPPIPTFSNGENNGTTGNN